MYYLIVMVLSLCLLTCKHREKEQHSATSFISENIGKHVELGSFDTVLKMDTCVDFEYKEWRSKKTYLHIIYLDEDCESCFSNFFEWQSKSATLTFPPNYSTLYVFRSNTPSIFFKRVRSMGIKKLNGFYISDPEFQFIKNNKDLPQWVLEKSFFVDKYNKIRFIGAPFATPEMTELFYKICQGEE